MYDDVRRLDLMREAIAEARKSICEDEKVHPLVGAILVDSDGTVLHRAHRGETGAGHHAEFVLLAKIEEAGTNTADTTLFVTLEPCTRRGSEKIPCAVRVAQSGIPRIYIGTLDPNPHITGRGEMFLAENMVVERFPWRLTEELMQLNAEFFEQHRHEHVPAVSLYASAGDELAEVSASAIKLSGQREGLLLQSTDLISGSSGDVCIIAGGLSWLREIQPVVLLAAMEQRKMRIVLVRGPESNGRARHAGRIAAALGAEAAVSTASLGTRATLIAPGTRAAAMVVVERAPSLHGSLFRKPHDAGTIEGYAFLFERLWDRAATMGQRQPQFRPVKESQVVKALRDGVPQYADARVEVSRVSPEDVVPLPSTLERLKLFRLSQLAALQSRHGVVSPCVIEDSPWPIMPPVVEVLADGRKIVVDGAHRFYLALNRGEDVAPVAVVHEAAGSLPATPRAGWDAVGMQTAKLPRSARYEEYREERFRPIRQAYESIAVTE